MKSWRPALASLAWLATATVHAQAPAADLYAGVTSVEVFANSAMQVSPVQSNRYQLAIYRLDAMQHVAALMNKGLPQNEADARRWIAENEPRLRRQIQPMVAGAAQGMSLARQYRIDRLPAVVVNRRYVVFGHADVDQALVALRTSQAKASKPAAIQKSKGS